MSGPSKSNAYGAAGGPASSSGGGDTARRTWDSAEYAAKAAEREAARRAEGKARAEAAASGRRYHRRELDMATAREASSRSARLDVAANVGKVQLVPAGAGVGKRGRSAGFYCQDCDLTFKDNLQWVEHLNSKQHLVAVGEKSEVSRATLQDVRDRIELLAETKRREREEDEKGARTNLEERLRRHQDDEERRKEEKRRKRREKRRKTEGGTGVGDDEQIQGGIIC